MKKITILLAALGAAAGLHAQDPKSSYSVTTDFAYTSKYVFRGVEAAGSSFQPSVEVTMQDFYLGLWTSQPITKHQDNEIDVYGGYKYKVNENLSLEAVGTYYWYPEAKGFSTRKSYEGGLGATYTVHGISATVNYYHDFKLKSNTVQGSLGYSLPIESIGASLDLTGFYGTVSARDWAPDGPAVIRESYDYYGLDASIPYKLSEKATFTLGGHWTHNRGYFADSGDSNVWWTAGVTVGF